MYNAKQKCEKAADYCLASSKYNPDWFVESKKLKAFHVALLINDDILFLMKILVKSHFGLMKLVFLARILIKLTLIMIKD